MKRACLSVLGLASLVACGDAATTPTSTDASVDGSVVDASVDVSPKDATSVPDTSGSDASDAAVDVFFDCSKPLVDPEIVLSGNPDFTVKEAVVFAAPVGTSNTDPFNQSLAQVEGPTHVYDATYVFFKAAQAHPPPYDTELATGLAASSFKNSGCFALSDLNAPNGIIFSFNLVPKSTALTGQSFENATTGPVIASDVVIDSNLYINGTLVDPDFDGTIAKASAVYGDVKYIGYAHLFLSAGENQAVSPKPLTVGDYRYEMKLTHQSGTSVTNVHFKVK